MAGKSRFIYLSGFLANYQFFYLISKERTTSIIVGCIGALFFLLCVYRKKIAN
ncbi:hypothetical protein OL548_19900 [Lysinibacillus sp. MHQ-1]|nr:hypothetical protein OL548_19900 [Lysinibacillus sp. MHQ-1]